MNRFVLMLEGDSDDRYLTQQTLSELGIDIPIKFSSNSTELFHLLFYSDKPSLLLINYNSSPDNGIEVLKKLKSSPDYNNIPVVIISDSDLPKYKNECYKFGASSDRKSVV